jgi:peptidoglycan/LPS O-acetylase OafA/YrhL
MKISATNNFDLIRLFAASQVVVNHMLHHLSLADATFSNYNRVFNFLPGVPIFFFVSGFLISASYARSRSGRRFFANRALRIFPALWACFALSVLSVWAFGYFDEVAVGAGAFAPWALAQLSIVQFYNPGFMRDYGVGVLNGSLWTISVELQFYLLVPVLFFFFRRSVALAVAIFGLFVAVNLTQSLVVQPVYGASIHALLLSVTFLPWIAMFMLGFSVHAWWPRLQGLFVGRFWIWLGIYAVLIAVGIVIENVWGTRWRSVDARRHRDVASNRRREVSDGRNCAR